MSNLRPVYRLFERAATCAASIACAGTFVYAAAAAPASTDIEFNRDVRPILSDNCFACHGPDANKRKAGLRLDQKESAFGKAESGEFAIVPGDPEKSELLRRI